MNQYESTVLSEDADPNVTVRRRRTINLDHPDKIAEGPENTTTGIEAPEDEDEDDQEGNWDNVSVRSARSN